MYRNVDGFIFGHTYKYKASITHTLYSDYQNSANFFLHTTLANANDNSDIHYVNGVRTTAGSVVQSLHKLKDTNNTGTSFSRFDVKNTTYSHFKI